VVQPSLKATSTLGPQARDGIARRNEQHPPLRSEALKWPRLAEQAVMHRANIDKLFYVSMTQVLIGIG
jgi:hypothetical protein